MAQIDHGPTIKDDEQYDALRRQGMSKEKAARIANSPKQSTGQKGGHAKKYEKQKKAELYEKARSIGIDGRSHMSKGELIDALRNH